TWWSSRRTPVPAARPRTDGLVEARDRDLDQGMGQLARALRPLDRPLDVLCDEVLVRLLGGSAQDDVAVLVARSLR
ncbi:SpoIIE family protein phosphatase, partial [Streptomyces sp. NPDC006324]|uniref:SpoIIE family protein phosphatase n=1 Tax=Streptomyces sp. NPDC006324 TaxID=3156751 RepID=UPI0033AC8F93